MIKLDWIEIPADEFLTGFSATQLSDIREHLDDKHRRFFDAAIANFDLKGRSLHLDTFYIARYPVTHDQLSEFYRRFPSLSTERVEPLTGELADFPEEATWPVADLFCHWVGGRLPTKFEWEKAARGTEGYLYPWGNVWNARLGNFTGSRDQPGYPERAKDVIWTSKSPVDGYPLGASPYQVFDMAGNISEWTMTVRPIPYTRQVGAVVKSRAAKDYSLPLWYWNISALEEVYPLGGMPANVGFRPVKDRWRHDLWQGFRIGNGE